MIFQLRRANDDNWHNTQELLAHEKKYPVEIYGPGKASQGHPAPGLRKFIALCCADRALVKFTIIAGMA